MNFKLDDVGCIEKLISSPDFRDMDEFYIEELFTSLLSLKELVSLNGLQNEMELKKVIMYWESVRKLISLPELRPSQVCYNTVINHEFILSCKFLSSFLTIITFIRTILTSILQYLRIY
jgi:hypothetical protein